MSPPTPTGPTVTKSALIAAVPVLATPVVSATPLPVAGPAAGAADAATNAPATGARYPRDSRYPARRPATRMTNPVVSGCFDAKTGSHLYETGQPTTLRLPGGGAIASVGANSTESNLFRFLSDPQVQVGTVDLTRGWYNFDRVFFEAGKAKLTLTSISQLRNIATLLRAFPKACIKLSGYTDDTGT